MEMRHLRYFVAVSESLHFGEAAAKLQIAQPSLSQQIRQLETELQTALLRRTKRRVQLTEAGQLFLVEARDILARTDRAAMVARRVGRGDGGRIRVAVGNCMNQMAMVRAVSAFNASHPKVRVELQTMAVHLQVAALRDDRLDVALVRYPLTEPALSSEVLASEPLVVALPRNHRFAGKQSVVLSHLANDPFVLAARELVPVDHDIVLRACREAGFVPNAPHEADQLSMLLGFVTAKCGVALVPAFARRTKPRHVAFAALRPSLNLQTVVVWRRDSTTPLLSEFVGIVRRALVPARDRATPNVKGTSRPRAGGL